ncbi:hypothetical protein ACFE04_012122 [Oxalis oulophora]
MSQEQACREVEEDVKQQHPITYGDVFPVSGELASKPIAPRDASMMQSAEAMVFGHTQKAGPAAAMQAAATRNELMGHRDATDVAAVQGVTVAETDIPGARIITESVGGQVVGHYVEATPVTQADIMAGLVEQKKITIGEALEAAIQTVGDKPVAQSDASAIQAAENRATGSNVTIPGGLAASAQSAADHNASMLRDEDRVKIRDVLLGASLKLPADKAVSKQDAEGVASAEMRNSATLETHPGGIASSMAAAARLNESIDV